MKHHAPETFNGANLVGTFEAGSEEWHEARKGAIGGSEIGTIMGLNQYESAYALMAKKLGKIPTEKLDNWAIRFGQKFEQPILELFQDEHPHFEIYTTGTYAHPELPYMHANPDALAKVNGKWVIVEVKTSKNYWYEIPPSYIAQVRWYMSVMNIDSAIIVGVVNMSWVEHWIERDSFEEDVLKQYGAEFYRRMQLCQMPEWDGAQSTYEAVRVMHPTITDEEVEIDGGHYLVKAQEDFDVAQAELLKAKSQVMSAMGNAKHAYVTHGEQKFRIASRQARGLTAPYLVVNKKGLPD